MIKVHCLLSFVSFQIVSRRNDKDFDWSHWSLRQKIKEINILSECELKSKFTVFKTKLVNLTYDKNNCFKNKIQHTISHFQKATMTGKIENKFRFSMPSIYTYNLVFVLLSKMSYLDS